MRVPPSVGSLTLPLPSLQRVCSSLGLPSSAVNDLCIKLGESPSVQHGSNNDDDDDPIVLGADSHVKGGEEGVGRGTGENGGVVLGHPTFVAKPAPYATSE